MITVEEDVEGLSVEYGNYVDEIKEKGTGFVVYMNEDYNKRFPPRRVIKAMATHDYYFMAPIVNGTPGDDREGFEFIGRDEMTISGRRTVGR